jgi:circadian clock protein KaiA
LAESLYPYLGGDGYVVKNFQTLEEFVAFVEGQKQQLDCLILQADAPLNSLLAALRQRGILLPAAIAHPDSPTPPTLDPPTDLDLTDAKVGSVPTANNGNPVTPEVVYHRAEVHFSWAQMSEVQRFVERAIAQFLDLCASANLVDNIKQPPDSSTDLSTQAFLLPQQRRLAEKLRERLGYLGVYYKRKPKYFLRNLPPAERQQFLEDLKSDYREIVLNYFDNDNTLNQQIDDFVNTAFLADVSVTQLVEVHMELMDDFAKQLKLEGRSEEILLDYRLTLIDIIAHLCEMYRRSIPRES